MAPDRTAMLALLLAACLASPAAAARAFPYDWEDEADIYLPPYGVLVDNCSHMHAVELRGLALFAPVSCSFHAQFGTGPAGLVPDSGNLERVTFFDASLLSPDGALRLCGPGLGREPGEGPFGGECLCEGRPAAARGRASGAGGRPRLSELGGGAVALASSTDLVERRELVRVALYACGERGWGLTVPRRALLGARQLTRETPFSNARLFSRRPLTTLDVESVGSFPPRLAHLGPGELAEFREFQGQWGSGGAENAGEADRGGSEPSGAPAAAPGDYHYVFLQNDRLARETLAGLAPGRFSPLVESLRLVCGRGGVSTLWFDSSTLRAGFAAALKPLLEQRGQGACRTLRDEFPGTGAGGGDQGADPAGKSENDSTPPPDPQGCVRFRDLPESVLREAGRLSSEALAAARRGPGREPPEFEGAHCLDLIRHLLLLEMGGWSFSPAAVASREFWAPGALYTLLPRLSGREGATPRLGPFYARSRADGVVSAAIRLLCDGAFLRERYWRAGPEELVRALQARYHGGDARLGAGTEGARLLGLRREAQPSEAFLVLDLRWRHPGWMQRAMLGLAAGLFTPVEKDGLWLSLPAYDPAGPPGGGAVSLSFAACPLGGPEGARGHEDAILASPREQGSPGPGGAPDTPETQGTPEAPPPTPGAQSYLVYLDRCEDARAPALEGSFVVLPPGCRPDPALLAARFAGYRTWYDARGEGDFWRDFALCGARFGAGVPAACRCGGAAAEGAAEGLAEGALAALDQALEWDRLLSRVGQEAPALYAVGALRPPGSPGRAPDRALGDALASALGDTLGDPRGAPAYLVVRSSDLLYGVGSLPALLFPCGGARERVAVTRAELAAMGPAAGLEVANPALVPGMVLYPDPADREPGAGESPGAADAAGTAGSADAPAPRPPLYHFIHTGDPEIVLAAPSLSTVMLERSLQAICGAGGEVLWWNAAPLPEAARARLERLPVLRARPACVEFRDLRLEDVARGAAHLELLRAVADGGPPAGAYHTQLADLLKPALLARHGGAILTAREVVFRPARGPRPALPLGPSGYLPAREYAPGPGSPLFEAVIDSQLAAPPDHADPHAFGARHLEAAVRACAPGSLDTLPGELVFAPLPPEDHPKLPYAPGGELDEVYLRYAGRALPWPYFPRLPKHEGLCSPKAAPGLSRRALEVIAGRCYCEPGVDAELDRMLGAWEGARG